MQFSGFLNALSNSGRQQLASVASYQALPCNYSSMPISVHTNKNSDKSNSLKLTNQTMPPFGLNLHQMLNSSSENNNTSTFYTESCSMSIVDNNNNVLVLYSDTTNNLCTRNENTNRSINVSNIIYHVVKFDHESGKNTIINNENNSIRFESNGVLFKIAAFFKTQQSL